MNSTRNKDKPDVFHTVWRKIYRTYKTAVAMYWHAVLRLRYAKKIKRMRQNSQNKLKIVFLVNETAKWKYQQVYNLLRDNNKYEVITKGSDITVYSNNKSETLDKYRRLGLNINDSYEYSKEKYMKERLEDLKGSLILGVIILSISLLEIYLMMRSSFLSRIKEVGILRAVGVKKKDIYKMFTGEIIAISTIASLLGVIFMTYVLKELSTITFISDRYMVNTQVFILTVIFIYTFNLFVGLLPVYRVVKKTPARILSRSDI